MTVDPRTATPNARTATLNDAAGIAPLFFEPVAGLRELGTGIVFPLALDVAGFRIGSGGDPENPKTPIAQTAEAQAAAKRHAEIEAMAEVIVARKYVSKRHCAIERRHTRVKVTNLSLKNGTRVGGVRHDEVMIDTGDVFRIGETDLLAVTPSAIAATSILGLLFGYDAHALIDRLLMAGMCNWSAAIVGPKHTGLREVAPILHSLSNLRARPLLSPTTTAEIDRAIRWFNGGIILDVDRLPCVPKVAPQLAASLAKQDLRQGTPLYAVGPSADVMTKQFGIRIGDDLTFALRPMKDRRGEGIVALAALLRALNPGVSMTALTPHNFRRLSEYSWPRDIDELRNAARHVEALIVEKGIGRQAATRLGVSHGAVQKWIKRLGLEFAAP